MASKPVYINPALEKPFRQETGLSCGDFKKKKCCKKYKKKGKHCGKCPKL